MSSKNVVLVGCGDIGRRIAKQLIADGMLLESIRAIVKSEQSVGLCKELGVQAAQIDLDKEIVLPDRIHGAQLFYLVPPQKEGLEDLRSREFIRSLTAQNLIPSKVVLISTTGVYGDSQGEWVTEQTATKPKVDRAVRRLDAEQQWQIWCDLFETGLTILRVVSIYSNSRIPIQRIESGSPVVIANECGYSNRIHADDLSAVAIAALADAVNGDVFNVSDGTPSKISEYLQEVASLMGAKSLPEMTMKEAKERLSDGMLSYLIESRKISNQKMLNKLKVALRYPDFKVGLRH